MNDDREHKPCLVKGAKGFANLYEMIMFCLHLEHDGCKIIHFENIRQSDLMWDNSDQIR